VARGRGAGGSPVAAAPLAGGRRQEWRRPS